MKLKTTTPSLSDHGLSIDKELKAAKDKANFVIGRSGKTLLCACTTGALFVPFELIEELPEFTNDNSKQLS